MPTRARSRRSMPVRLTRLSLIVSGWALSQFCITALVLQFARPRLDPWTSTLSRYLTGPGGDWLVAAYLVLALGLVLFGVVIEQVERRDGSVFVPVAYVVAAFGIATAGLIHHPFRNDGSAAWWLWHLHLLAAGLAFVALGLIAWTTSWGSSRVFVSRWHRGCARVLATLVLGLEIVYVIRSPRGGGAYEKVLIILLALWLGLRWLVAYRDKWRKCEPPA